MKDKILIVEDEAGIRISLYDALVIEGFDCYQAGSGEEALEVLRKVTPDLIISDIMMPGMDGFEFYEKVKQKHSTMLVPFLFLTAKADEASVRKGMNLGADDYLKKPYQLQDLLSSVRIRLEKKKQVDATLDRLGKNIAKYVPHELRTPLVAIIGNSNLYLDYKDTLDEIEKENLIESVSRSAYRLLARIERFLLYSELEVTPPESYLSIVSKDLGVDPSNYDYNEYHKKSYQCSDRLSDFNINFEPAKLKIFERDFLFIVNELITNACKFSEKGTPIIVNGLKRDKSYVITVEDRGCGISSGELADYRGFLQFDRDDRQQIGNGLGLAIISKLSGIYDFRFNLESEIVKFTRARVELSISEE